MKKTSRGKKTELYILSEDDLWFVPQHHKEPIKKKRFFIRNTLRYCKSCKTQWEIGTTGSQIHYEHLPTYGLKRVTCNNCKNI